MCATIERVIPPNWELSIVQLNITLHYITLQCAAQHYITLNHITLCSSTLHYITSHFSVQLNITFTSLSLSTATPFQCHKYISRKFCKKRGHVGQHTNDLFNKFSVIHNILFVFSDCSKYTKRCLCGSRQLVLIQCAAEDTHKKACFYKQTKSRHSVFTF